MRIGIIGLGMVGGTLKRWLEKFTDHTLCLRDPNKNLNDDFTGCDAIFVCIPVPASATGQNQEELEQVVRQAKLYTDNVFIKSTVLPGTNDRLGTISSPEFLTERWCDTDMSNLPIIVGEKGFALARKIFPTKHVFMGSNFECELAKYAHNVFGAMKVTYWNIIYELCKQNDAKYSNVLGIALNTGFIHPQHTHVPGPDGKRGYGGKCFPENVASFKSVSGAESFFQEIENLNRYFRGQPA